MRVGLIITAMFAVAAPSTAKVIDFEEFSVGDRPLLYSTLFQGEQRAFFRVPGVVAEKDGNKFLVLEPNIYNHTVLTYNTVFLGRDPENSIQRYYYVPQMSTIDVLSINGGEALGYMFPRQALPAGEWKTVRFINYSGFSSGSHSGEIRGGLAYIDNIRFEDRVTLTPEPDTWAMMIAGFGLAGFAARRRGIQGNGALRV